jgi:hypothetical protein
MNNEAQPLSHSYADWSTDMLVEEVKFFSGLQNYTPVSLATLEAMREELEIRAKYGI